MSYLIFYDGDGGGLCGHLRNRFELSVLSDLSGSQIIDVYPYTRLLCDQVYCKLEPDQLTDAVLLSDLVKKSSDIYELANRVKTLQGRYILAGRHHYSHLFKEYLSTLPSWEVVNLFRAMFSRIGFTSSGIVSRMPFQLRQTTQLNQNTSGSIHLRTLIDSKEGYNQFLAKRPQIYGWISFYLLQLYRRYSGGSCVFLATDNSDEMQAMRRLVIYYGLSPIIGKQFSHSTLATYYGKDLLARVDDIAYQKQACQSQFLNDTINWDSLCELVGIANSSHIIATDSTFSQVAYLIGNARSYHCFGFDYDSLSAFK
jgi:hypothetical protein